MRLGLQRPNSKRRRRDGRIMMTAVASRLLICNTMFIDLPPVGCGDAVADDPREQA
jgi:hypothetical protein